MTFTSDELFAIQVLCHLNVTNLQWDGGDADELEERFRRGKRSLKSKEWTDGLSTSNNPVS